MILPSPRAIDWRRASHSAYQAGTRLTIMALIAPIRPRIPAIPAPNANGHLCKAVNSGATAHFPTFIDSAESTSQEHENTLLRFARLWRG